VTATKSDKWRCAARYDTSNVSNARQLDLLSACDFIYDGVVVLASDLMHYCLINTFSIDKNLYLHVVDNIAVAFRAYFYS
jgi:hypothetical protein